MTDVFEVQAEIATNVAQALRVRLTPSMERALARRPTSDLDAYDQYLRGLEILSQAGDPTGQKARAAFAQAVRLDSSFALAWAYLALAEGRIYLNGREPQRAEAMRQATDRALALAPELPEAHARLGEYQSWVRHDNSSALAAYRTGLRFNPNNALLLARVGWAEMRLGHWDSALVHLVQGTRLDPRSPSRFADLGAAHLYLRRYADAREDLNRYATLAPASGSHFERRLWLELGRGDLEAARGVLRSLPPEVDVLTFFAGYPTWQRTWALDSLQLRQLVDSAKASSEQSPAKALILAEAYLRLSDSVQSHAWAERAVRGYRQTLARSPDDPELRSAYALALAYLGRRREAIWEGLRAKTLVPISSDAIAGQQYQAALVRIYLITNEPESALNELEPLLRVPGSLSREWLRIDPTFAPLRGNPRFERLVNGS